MRAYRVPSIALSAKRGMAPLSPTARTSEGVLFIMLLTPQRWKLRPGEMKRTQVGSLGTRGAGIPIHVLLAPFSARAVSGLRL